MATRVSRGKAKGFDYGAYFREMRTLHDLTTLPEEKKWRAVPPTAPEPHRVVLYLGCNVLRTSHMIRTVADVFDLLGVDYVTVGGPAYCCGLVQHRLGDTETAQTMGRNAVRHFQRFEPERVVMWCPSCIFYYDEIFEAPAPFPVQHVSEFLVEHLAEMKFVREVPARVALHYHCKPPRRLGEARAATTLLRAVPGLKLVESDGIAQFEGQCSELVQQALGPGVLERIVEQQLQEAVAAGANTLATLYHGCQRLICAYEESYPLTIEHFLSVFARALGIEHEDRYKKYRLWRDPERTLAEMAPCLRTNRVKEAEARETVLRIFPGR